jgi:two-component system NarL family response regulator
MTNSHALKVLVAEDHFLARLAVTKLIEDDPGITVVAQATSGWQAVDLFRKHAPDIVLMDLRMPDMDGIAATAAICREQPNARVLILSNYENEEDVRRAMAAGARGYIKKDVEGDVLLNAIRMVAAGQKYVPASFGAGKADEGARSPVTARELEILNLIFKGMSNQGIATELSISEGTVRIHVSNILFKLGVKRRTEAVALALKKGLIRTQE